MTMHSHVSCWKEWAKNDPEYQIALALYKADPHPNYYMLDPDDADKTIDINDSETVVLRIQ